jgi:hypothetical protein
MMKTPTIKWAQNDSYVFVDIELVPKDFKIDIKENEICFKQGEYECNFNLFTNIIVDESKYRTNRIFELVLKKADDEEWKQLLENKNQFKVGVNWDKCEIEDDEKEPEIPNDLSSMMGGMPGDLSSMMGGMPGDFASMGNCCEDDACNGCEDEFEVNTDDDTDNPDTSTDEKNPSVEQ